VELEVKKRKMLTINRKAYTLCSAPNSLPPQIRKRHSKNRYQYTRVEVSNPHVSEFEHQLTSQQSRN
jgi:hypothetical protein